MAEEYVSLQLMRQLSEKLQIGESFVDLCGQLSQGNTIDGGNSPILESKISYTHDLIFVQNSIQEALVRGEISEREYVNAALLVHTALRKINKPQDEGLFKAINQAKLHSNGLFQNIDDPSEFASQYEIKYPKVGRRAIDYTDKIGVFRQFFPNDVPLEMSLLGKFATRSYSEMMISDMRKQFQKYPQSKDKLDVIMMMNMNSQARDIAVSLATHLLAQDITGKLVDPMTCTRYSNLSENIYQISFRFNEFSGVVDTVFNNQRPGGIQDKGIRELLNYADMLDANIDQKLLQVFGDETLAQEMKSYYKRYLEVCGFDRKFEDNKLASLNRSDLLHILCEDSPNVVTIKTELAGYESKSNVSKGQIDNSSKPNKYHQIVGYIRPIRV